MMKLAKFLKPFMSVVPARPGETTVEFKTEDTITGATERVVPRLSVKNMGYDAEKNTWVVMLNITEPKPEGGL